MMKMHQIETKVLPNFDDIDTNIGDDFGKCSSSILDSSEIIRKHGFSHPGGVIKRNYVDWGRITPESLAEKTGIPQSKVNRILSEKMEVDEDMSRKISAALDLKDTGLWYRIQLKHNKHSLPL